MATAARLYLFVGLLGIGAYVAMGGDGTLYEAYGQASWLAVAVGTLLNRPPRALGWWLLAGAMAALAAGDAFFFSYYADGAPFPSLADPLYLSGTTVFAVALGLLVRRGRAFRQELVTLGDAFVLSLAIGLFLWSWFFSGALGSGGGVGRVVSIAYPVIDLALLAVLVRGLLMQGRRTASYWYLMVSVVLLVVSDAWYVVPALTDHYVAGTWRDSGWLASYLLAGTAALHPSMRPFVARRDSVIPVRRTILLGSSLVLVALALVGQQAIDGAADVYAFGLCGAAMAAFITLRVAGLVRALEATTAAAEASERRFRMVFEHSPIGISVGRDGMMQETNPALQRMLGYTGEELARKHFIDVTHTDDRELSVQHELDDGMREGFSIDKRYTRKDGTVVDTHVNVALDVQDGFGISLIEDVTERRGLEAQLLQSQKMDAVGKLAGGVAHDFNNLMTAVIGYSDLLLGGLDGDPRKEKVEAIRDSAVRASDLTRQLLAFSRRQLLHVEEVDLRDVVIGVDGLLRRLLGDAVALQTVYGDAPILVRADRSQLEQVVVNLAVNARDAMPAGGTVRLTVWAEDGEAVLSVSDTGVGMDDQTRARIFEPFFTTKQLHEASGLGLSTVHGIVGQTGGRVDVVSAPHEGTVFTVRLPLLATVATLVD